VIRKILDKKGLSYPYQYVPAKVRVNGKVGTRASG